MSEIKVTEKNVQTVDESIVIVRAIKSNLPPGPQQDGIIALLIQMHRLRRKLINLLQQSDSLFN